MVQGVKFSDTIVHTVWPILEELEDENWRFDLKDVSGLDSTDEHMYLCNIWDEVCFIVVNLVLGLLSVDQFELLEELVFWSSSDIAITLKCSDYERLF